MSDGGSGQRVADWLGDERSGGVSELDECVDDVEVEASEFGDAVCSEYGDGEWLSRYVGASAESQVEKPSFEGMAVVESCLLETALAEQRLVASGMRRTYVRGRVHLDTVYGASVMTRQKLFMVNSYMAITSLEDAALFERLRSSRVVTRLGAPTGLGKTMALPGMIAKKCGLRVCQVELDAVIAKQAMAVQREKFGIPVSSRMWKREKQAFLAVISYEDFRGICCSAGRKRFFSDFDVFYFDEAHVPLSAVYLAKQYFGTFSMAHNSLIIASATVSTEESNNMVAQRVGKFVEEPVRGGFDALLKSGELVSKYCVDRTLVLVAGNRKVYSVASYYEEAGCDVKMLDLASRKKDVDQVVDWLTPDGSAVPRVLVATSEYGTGYNFPVSYVVTSATKMIYVADGVGGLVEQEIPLRAVEVQQHKGRTGRGMVVGSGGIVASVAVDSSAADLMRCEMLRAYLGLVAADVEPRAGLFDEVKAVLPKGITRDVAITLLSVELPPALVLRYLGSDGRVASRFVKGMRLYTQPDHFLHASRDVDPVGYSNWVSEDVGSYFEGDTSRSAVKVLVPFFSPASLKVVMHTLFAVSRGWLSLPVWVSEASDESGSDGEDVGLRSKVRSEVRPVKLRVVTEKEVVAEVQESPAVSWQYDVDPDKLEKKNRRRAMSWLDTTEGKASVEGIVSRVDGDGVVGVATADVKRRSVEGVVFVEVQSAVCGDVDVESPGGSVVAKLTEKLYERLVSGMAVQPGFFVDLLKAVRRSGDRLVKSSLFDNWAPPWLSVLRTYADRDAVEFAKRSGLSSTMSKLLAYMYDRFKVEAMAVFATSNLYKSKLKGFFSRGAVSTTRLERYIRQGRMPIAQSDAFVRRFLEVKEAHSRALACLEYVGVFAPDVVTRAQQRMPLRARAGVMPVLGEEVVSPRAGMARW